MIGQIHGTLVEKNPPQIGVEVQGICYEVQVPMTTLFRLPDMGRPVRLHTHLLQREDAQHLFGFIDPQDKALFRALIRVNGVGPRMALAILSGMDSGDFVRTVRNNDVNALVNTPGIGRKTAERLMMEMRDRLEEWGQPPDSTAAPETKKTPDTKDAKDAPKQRPGDTSRPAQTISAPRDAQKALVALGYKPQQAAAAVDRVRRIAAADADLETLIRLSLKDLN